MDMLTPSADSDTSRSEPARTEIQLSVVIPAFNEAARLRPSVAGLIAFLRASGKSFEVVIVDDGSTDHTSTIAKSLAAGAPEIRVLSHQRNQGKGAAVRLGVLASRGRRVLFTDADAPVPWSELERLERALAEGADVAIGSKALGEGALASVGALRRLMSWVFNQAVSLLVLKGIADTQCGFKLFAAPVARELFGNSTLRGFSFDVEVLLLARERGYRVIEVPVQVRRIDGTSVSIVVDSLRMLVDLVKLRSSRRALSIGRRPPEREPVTRQPEAG